MDLGKKWPADSVNFFLGDHGAWRCARSNKSFKCRNKACGWIGDADENASKMIALVGLSVNQPRGSQLLACSITEGLLKAPPF